MRCSLRYGDGDALEGGVSLAKGADSFVPDARPTWGATLAVRVTATPFSDGILEAARLEGTR